ncbi:hypothetical protein CRYUN_Cryun07bG0030700 [Craigia yunnanensis]
MEGSESEAIFDSLNLNPQLFINETLNTVDDLLNDAFDFYLQEASKLLKIEGTDRSQDLTKGVNYIRNMIQSSLDKRLAMWEKYCLRHCFTVPEGFSLPKNDELSGSSSMVQDTLSDPNVDAELDSLRDKLTLVGAESDKLDSELKELERQSASSRHCTGLINEALQLYEDTSVHDMFQEKGIIPLSLFPISFTYRRFKTECAISSISSQYILSIEAFLYSRPSPFVIVELVIGTIWPDF